MATTRRVLVVASAGGHWVQLMRLRPAWDGHFVTYVTTSGAFREEVERDAIARGQRKPGFFVVPEANRWQKLKLLRQLVGIVVIMLRIRPNTVITTGASPGYFALRLGSLIGARTAWVDSIANAEELSLSGERAGRHATLWLTQWPHLARPEGPEFRGTVL